ncbi:MAG: hypothetical protein WC071_13340 [Victivallaceae bacterium]
MAIDREQEALEKIKQIAAEAGADYPYWNRGIKFGIAGGMFFLCAGIAFSAVGSKWMNPAGVAIGAFVAGFILLGSIGAFRPDKNQTLSGKR